MKTADGKREILFAFDQRITKLRRAMSFFSWAMSSLRKILIRFRGRISEIDKNSSVVSFYALAVAKFNT